MKVARFLIVGVTLTAMVVVARVPAAMACSCIPSPPDQKALRQAEAVFTGVPIDAVDSNPWRWLFMSSGDPVHYTFEVDGVAKGDLHEYEVVTSVRSGASCGFSFREGARYLVFATSNNGELDTGLCTNTRKIGARFVADFELDEPLPGGVRPNDGIDTWKWIAGGVGIAGAVGLAVWRRRRTRLTSIHSDLG